MHSACCASGTYRWEIKSITMSLKASKEINKLLPHVFYECSELPALPPLFSCSACDTWRERIHNKGSRAIHRRDFLNDRYQCSRAKKGKPIKVRVVCKAAAVSNPRITSATKLSGVGIWCK
jgi:hypothetical protein